MKVCKLVCLAGLLGSAFVLPALRGQTQQFLRGDSNLDGELDISDGVFTLRVLFLGEAPPGCDDAADVDDDGLLAVTDAIYSFRFLFQDGPPPAGSFDACGGDATPDALECLSYPACASTSLPCIDAAALDALLGNSATFSFCLPAGLLDVPLDPLTISVCPLDSAPACGISGDPGCLVEITSVSAAVDVEGRRLVARFEGRVEDMPVNVTESLFNSTTTCLTDIHGATSALPFSFELAVPLTVEERPGGDLEIVEVGEGVVENTDVGLTSTGGIVCALFQAAGGSFTQLLLTPLSTVAQTLSQQLSGLLVGSGLCIAGQ